MSFAEKLQKCPLIAILRGITPAEIDAVCEVLYESGFRMLEIPLNSPDALESIRRAANRWHEGEKMLIGAGTVLNVPMAEAAADAGAEFLVSPACSPAVIETAHRRGAAVIPGALTPNEILHAWEAGADLVKLFPILPGQEQYVKTVMAPLSHIPFIVTGGVTPETLRSMLATGAVAVGAGASVFPPAPVERHDRTALARQIELHFREIVHG